MTIEDLFKDSSEKLREAGFIHAEKEVGFILSKVFAEDSAWFLSHGEDEADADKVEITEDLIKKRLQGCPLAYLLGEQPFLGWKFIADKRGLIPRPETELLVELLSKQIREFSLQDKKFLEIGAGSGPIAISLKMFFPDADVTATDVSAEAIDLAEENAKNIGADVEFLEGNLFEPVKAGKYDVIVANLPYVPTERLEFVSDQILDWEPMVAIEAGSDGLKYIEPFMAKLPEYLAKDGIAAIEMWHDHTEPVREFAKRFLPNHEVVIEKDLAGYDRYAFFLPL